MQTVIVIVIVAAAAAYLIRRLIRRGPAGCCGCTRCGTDTETCAGRTKTRQDKPAGDGGEKHP